MFVQILNLNNKPLDIPKYVLYYEYIKIKLNLYNKIQVITDMYFLRGDLIIPYDEGGETYES